MQKIMIGLLLSTVAMSAGAGCLGDMPPILVEPQGSLGFLSPKPKYSETIHAEAVFGAPQVISKNKVQIPYQIVNNSDRDICAPRFEFERLNISAYVDNNPTNENMNKIKALYPNFDWDDDNFGKLDANGNKVGEGYKNGVIIETSSDHSMVAPSPIIRIKAGGTRNFVATSSSKLKATAVLEDTGTCSDLYSDPARDISLDVFESMKLELNIRLVEPSLQYCQDFKNLADPAINSAWKTELIKNGKGDNVLNLQKSNNVSYDMIFVPEMKILGNSE